MEDNYNFDQLPFQASNISAGEILDSLFFDSEDVYGGAGIGITPLDSGGGVMNVSSHATTETEEVRSSSRVTYPNTIWVVTGNGCENGFYGRPQFPQ